MAFKTRTKRIVRKKRHKTWQLQEAKARFSELVNEVVEEGYQTITKNGHPVVVIVSCEEFERFKTSKNTLGEFLLESPFANSELVLERDKPLGRDTDL